MSLRQGLAMLAQASAWLAAMIAAPALAQPVGVNAAVRNVVTMNSPDNPTPRPAVVKQRVMVGNQVTTGAASALQVLLLDRSVFTVGANARVTIDRYVYDPRRNSAAVSASIAQGAFRFMSSRAVHANPNKSTLRTPVASIGIRGTIVEGVVGEAARGLAAKLPEIAATAGSGSGANASFIILVGPGPGSQDAGGAGGIDVTAGGRTVAVDRPGMAVYVADADQPPTDPIMVSAEIMREVEDAIDDADAADDESGDAGDESADAADTADGGADESAAAAPDEGASADAEFGGDESTGADASEDTGGDVNTGGEVDAGDFDAGGTDMGLDDGFGTGDAIDPGGTVSDTLSDAIDEEPESEEPPPPNDMQPQ